MIWTRLVNPLFPSSSAALPSKGFHDFLLHQPSAPAGLLNDPSQWRCYRNDLRKCFYLTGSAGLLFQLPRLSAQMSSTAGEGCKAVEYGHFPNSIGKAVMGWLMERRHSRQLCMEHTGH